MTDDLERRLREAFEAKATSITPSMMDMDREREFTDELDDDRGPRRWMVGGLSAAAAVAAAIGIGVVVSNQHPPTRAPAVAASTQHTETNVSTQPPSPSHTPLRHPKLQSDIPPQATQAPPPTTQTTVEPPPSSASTTTTAPKMSPDSSSAPTHSTSSPTSPKTSTDGNYHLRGTLRTAAGTNYLPLPASIPAYIQSETGRTTILSTAIAGGPHRDSQTDCDGISAYWQKVMPSDGWTKASDPQVMSKWIAPSGNAWTFLSTASSGCTIQISAGP